VEDSPRITGPEPHRKPVARVKGVLRREVKPKTKSELVDGIVEFRGTVSSKKCRKYIRHLDKVIPRIELGGVPQDINTYSSIYNICSFNYL